MRNSFQVHGAFTGAEVFQKYTDGFSARTEKKHGNGNREAPVLFSFIGPEGGRSVFDWETKRMNIFTLIITLVLSGTWRLNTGHRNKEHIPKGSERSLSRRPPFGERAYDSATTLFSGTHN